MSGYTDPDRYPSMKAERRPTFGVQAAGYGIGFLIYGIIGLASGQLLGLNSVTFLHDHATAVSTILTIVGALFLALGWTRPE